jgi:hypothetical protein
MRSLLLFALVLVLVLGLVPVGGCKKAMNKLSKDTEVQSHEKFKSTQHWLTDQKGAGNQPAVHAPTGVVVNTGGGGGSGGAAQAVRQAAVRTVNRNELNNIRLFIDTASAVGQMPTRQEIMQSLQRDAQATYKLVEEGVIILTGTRSRENIWAYTYNPQTAAGEHLVVTASGIEQITTQRLTQMLKQQGLLSGS